MRFGYDAKRAFHNNSGLGNYSRDMIRILSHQFPENEYFLYNPKASSRSLEGSNFNIQYPDSPLWKFFSGLWRQVGMAKQIEKDKIDLYHGLSGEITRGIHKAQTKIVVTIHDLIPERFSALYKAVDRKIYRNKVNYAVQHADRILAISEQTREDIVHFLKVDREKITVHYQGCHKVFKEKYHLSEKINLREKYGLPEDFILNVGTLEERKNALFILKALKDLPYQLVLVGKQTKYVELLKEFIVENNMQERVHFLQGIGMEELAILYQAATLFCYPSIFEGFGIPIIEALYSGTPVISSTGSCFAEAGGPDSVYVPPGNVNELKNAIEELMQDPEKRNAMNESGLLFVQKFNDDKVGENLMNIYNELLQ